MPACGKVCCRDLLVFPSRRWDFVDGFDRRLVSFARRGFTGFRGVELRLRGFRLHLQFIGAFLRGFVARIGLAVFILRLFPREFGFLHLTERSARFDLAALQCIVGRLRVRERRGKRQ